MGKLDSLIQEKASDDEKLLMKRYGFMIFFSSLLKLRQLDKEY